jgi:hypothetical protein
MKEDVQDMVSALMQGDTETAKEMFSTILATKISDRLDAYKEELGSSLLATESVDLEEGKRYSDSFRFNYVAGNEDHEKQLSDLKADIAKHNKENPDNKKRVVLQGRLGKNSPHAKLYSKASMRDGTWEGSGFGSHQRIMKRHAASHDVYVYDRQ